MNTQQAKAVAQQDQHRAEARRQLADLLESAMPVLGPLTGILDRNVVTSAEEVRIILAAARIGQAVLSFVVLDGAFDAVDQLRSLASDRAGRGTGGNGEAM